MTNPLCPDCKHCKPHGLPYLPFVQVPHCWHPETLNPVTAKPTLSCADQRYGDKAGRCGLSGTLWEAKGFRASERDGPTMNERFQQVYPAYTDVTPDPATQLFYNPKTREFEDSNGKKLSASGPPRMSWADLEQPQFAPTDAVAIVRRFR